MAKTSKYKAILSDSDIPLNENGRITVYISKAARIKAEALKDLTGGQPKRCNRTRDSFLFRIYLNRYGTILSLRYLRNRAESRYSEIRSPDSEKSYTAWR